MASYQKISNILDFAVSFNPLSAFPIDARSMFGSKAAAEAAAATAVNAGSSESAYYFGQTLTVFEDDVATSYLIQGDGTLKETGSTVLADNKSILIQDNVVSLYDFGKQYYAYHEADETHASSWYELVTGWKAGLTPRVVSSDSGYALAWYEPSTTTIEGVSESISTMRTEMDTMKTRVDDIDEAVANNKAAITTESERAVAAEEALANRATALETVTTRLDGDANTEGSVKNQIATAISQIMDNPDETLNSIKELVEWTENHATEVVELQNNVTANSTAINALSELVGTLPEGTSATTVIEYIVEAVNTEKTRAEAKEAELQTSINKNATDITDIKTTLNGLDTKYATAEQGALAESAVQEVVAGDTNGHIKVDGTDVTVYEAPIAKTNALGDVKPDGSSISVAEDGTISVATVDASKITGLDTKLDETKSAAVTEAKNYADEKFIAKTQLLTASEVASSAEEASDTNIISEKALISMLEWKHTM